MSCMLPSKSCEPQDKYTLQIRTYLLEHDAVFRELHALREDGHNNPKADEHFKNQRNRADNVTEARELHFYKMMQSVAAELNNIVRGALVIKSRPTTNSTPPAPAVLDLCMAPGGFSAAALALNPAAQLRGITLPPDKGGHDLLLPVDGDSVQVEYTDITLLASVMGISREEIPASHPDTANFCYDNPFSDLRFDLVFCDGQVLRTHEVHRYAYREKCEATRLLTSQLVLAFGRIREGGTLVMLLHRVDMFATAQLLYTVSRVADVRLFKSRKAWKMRGAFYLVAENVRPGCAEAVEMVERWKALWRMATFGESGWGDKDEEERYWLDIGVEELLAKFGETLIRLARPVWRTQAAALRKAPWNRSREV